MCKGEFQVITGLPDLRILVEMWPHEHDDDAAVVDVGCCLPAGLPDALRFPLGMGPWMLMLVLRACWCLLARLLACLSH